MFRGGDRLQQRAELDAVLQPDVRGGNFIRRGRCAGEFAQFVPRKNGFERDRRLRALVRRYVRVQRGDDFASRRRLVLQIGDALENFHDHQNARLESFRRAEFREQPVLQRSFLHLINDQLRFFQRHDEVAVLFHLALGGFPPFFPVVADDIGREDLLDLIRRRLAAKTVQNQFDQIQMMRGHLPHAFEVGGLARENVILWNRLELLRRERQIHRVPRLAGKINREAREHRVHRLDAPEAPAPVHAAAAFRQFGEWFDMASLDFPRRRQFFKFVSHKSFSLASQ